MDFMREWRQFIGFSVCMMIVEYTINLENDWFASLSCLVTFLNEEGFVVDYNNKKEPRTLIFDAQNAND